jgi:hypothetical protein
VTDRATPPASILQGPCILSLQHNVWVGFCSSTLWYVLVAQSIECSSIPIQLQYLLLARFQGRHWCQHICLCLMECVFVSELGSKVADVFVPPSTWVSEWGPGWSERHGQKTIMESSMGLGQEDPQTRQAPPNFGPDSESPKVWTVSSEHQAPNTMLLWGGPALPSCLTVGRHSRSLDGTAPVHQFLTSVYIWTTSDNI